MKLNIKNIISLSILNIGMQSAYLITGRRRPWVLKTANDVRSDRVCECNRTHKEVTFSRSEGHVFIFIA